MKNALKTYKNKVLIIFLITAFILIGYPIQAPAANGPLDEILLYEVNVEVQTDGTLIDTYHIQWKVLDDTSEGPLTWVKIGMPNNNWNIISTSETIASASSLDGYIRLDLDKAYYKNDVADFSFMVNQRDMLCDFSSTASSFFFADQNGAAGNTDLQDIAYFIDFTPGWFTDTSVEKYKFTISPAGIISEGNQDRVEGDSLVWEGSLGNNEHREMEVFYGASAFVNPATVQWKPIDYNNDYGNDNNNDYNADSGAGNDSGSGVGAVNFFIIIFVALVIFTRFFGIGGGYRRGRGFGGGGFHGGGGGGCACAGCACACACAGGGRAGCSMKGFSSKVRNGGISL